MLDVKQFFNVLCGTKYANFSGGAVLENYSNRCAILVTFPRINSLDADLFIGIASIQESWSRKNLKRSTFRVFWAGQYEFVKD